MKLKQIGPAAFARIYYQHMIYDFPRQELKPYWILLRTYIRKHCRFYGLYDGRTLLSYAVVLFDQPGNAGILDYLAAVRTHRGQGAGSEMLRLLRAELTDYAGILIEYEFPEDAEAEAERLIRTRRENFYLRSGVRRTKLDLILFGVHFRVGYLPCTKDVPDAELKTMQIAVYDAVNCWDYHFQDQL